MPELKMTGGELTMTKRYISISEKAVLTKEKVYSVKDGRMVEMYFVYRVEVDSKGRTWHIPLDKNDHPDCNVEVRGILGDGIKSLRKAKVIYLIESI